MTAARRWRRPVAAWLAALGVAAAVAGCTAPADPARPGTAAEPATVRLGPSRLAADHAGPDAFGSSVAAPACDPRASLRPPAGALPPPGQMPAGSYMEEIRKRGRLIVAASQDTFLFSSRNPFSGVIEGFDVDVARLVSEAIFGDPKKVQISVTPSSDRIPKITKGTVDLVAETMTINCERLQTVDFSTVYYQAGQKVLVAKTATATDIGDLGGKRVCAAAGSTSLDNLGKVRPKLQPVSASTWTDCLVLFQQGTIDAVSTDDTILAGLAAQDPYAKVVGPQFTDEPYGVAVSKEHPEFTRFVNAVLERARADGTWAKMYAKWLGRLGPAPTPPAAKYRD